MFVCKNHVLEGVKNLKLPHVRTNDKKISCRYCNNLAIFELYYLNYNAKPKKSFFSRRSLYVKGY